jgi:hypothetical protein
MTPAELAAHLPSRLIRWAPQFLAANICYGVDPFLLAAICDRESLGGEALTPKGPKGTGDHGHGRGLMQIDDRTHHGFIHGKFDEGTPLWHDPTFSILYAGRLLYRNILYCGQLEECGVAAYNCGVGRVRIALTNFTQLTTLEQRIRVLNKLTTGGDYVTDVFRRRDQFRNSLNPGTT